GAHVHRRDDHGAARGLADEEARPALGRAHPGRLRDAREHVLGRDLRLPHAGRRVLRPRPAGERSDDPAVRRGGRAGGGAPAAAAAIIQFCGGIHEIYFPYVLMKPILILAAIGGGMAGVAVNVAFGTGLIAPASPGSIFAIFGVAARDSYLGIALAVLAAA